MPKFQDLGLHLVYQWIILVSVALIRTSIVNTNINSNIIDMHIDLDEKHFSPIILSDMDMFHMALTACTYKRG